MLKLSSKQNAALDLMTDSTTKIVGFGGAAYGGKSFLGCYIALLFSTCLNGSKAFIGRDSLKDTRESVLFTFRKVAKKLNIYNWKYKENHIYFTNGSQIEFIDLSYMPNKDPEFERFGSKEYTWGWIEEAGAVHPKAFEVINTRVGRWYNKEFGIPGKLLVTFNPRRNWVHSVFYLPYRNNQETKDVKFIRALYTDNPDPDENYVNRLKGIKDKATRERLLNGNFDYEDDPTNLLNYEQIYNIWYNYHIPQNNKKYLIADIARFGSDDAIIAIFNDWRLIEYYVINISETTRLQQIINALRMKHHIPASNSLADEDGVGGGVVDNCKILGFHNGGKPLDPAFFRLKDQCGYVLADNIHKLHIEAPVTQIMKDRIENELSQLKTFETDKDGKLRILPKVYIKENIGHSPDWLDIFIMRAYFDIINPDNFEHILNKALKYIS